MREIRGRTAHMHSRACIMRTYVHASTEGSLCIPSEWERRRNHKLENRNDHPRIKETGFHDVARKLAKRSNEFPANLRKSSRGEYVTREAKLVGERAMRRRSPLWQTRTLPRASCRARCKMREKDEFSGAFKPQRTSIHGFRPKCFNYSRYKSIGNVKSPRPGTG